uniref:Uncharacterized protein n=1 Tax=Anguilla anguilla TaxID=7936 RepID=A0A0E9SE98_ANGAN
MHRNMDSWTLVECDEVCGDRVTRLAERLGPGDVAMTTPSTPLKRRCDFARSFLES